MIENRILYTFEQSEFPFYKKLKLEEGYKIESISNFFTKEAIEKIDTYNDYIIDISSLAPLISKGESIQYIFEQLHPLFPVNTVFIVEKKHTDIIFHEFRHCFDDINKIEITLESIEAIDNIDSESKIKKIINLDNAELDSFFEEFDNKLYGHDEFKKEFKEIVQTFKVFNKLGEQRVLSLFLMGDSGVGKTEVARVIHKCLQSNKKLAKINFGNYSSKDALNSLIGSPRGYIGSENGELFQRVKESDIGLILIDEFEKSNSAVFNYFLDVLESGKITNSLAEEIDINGYIIVFTSNIPRNEFNVRISPELRSRFDYKGAFNLLTKEDKTKFVRYRFSDIISKYEENFNIKLPSYLHGHLVGLIDVDKFNNMRNLNKRIKDVFVHYIYNGLF